MELIIKFVIGFIAGVAAVTAYRWLAANLSSFISYTEYISEAGKRIKFRDGSEFDKLTQALASAKHEVRKEWCSVTLFLLDDNLFFRFLTKEYQKIGGSKNLREIISPVKTMDIMGCVNCPVRKIYINSRAKPVILTEVDNVILIFKSYNDFIKGVESDNIYNYAPIRF